MAYKGIFKSALEILYATADIVDEVSSTVTYLGFQSTGISVSSAYWAICKIEISGTITTTKWADGSRNENYIWDNRATYTYLFKMF